MSACPHTGVSLPECSCSACVQALIERHAPREGEAAEVATRLHRLPRFGLAARLRARWARRAA